MENLNAENCEEIRQCGINFIYPSGMTAQGMALAYDRVKNVSFLLGKGQIRTFAGRKANPALWDACYSGFPRLMVLFLMYGVDPALGKFDGSGTRAKQVMRAIGVGESLVGLFAQHVSQS